MRVNKLIDHTLLKANATKDQITKLCNEAIKYEFASVCVNTCWVDYCHSLLQGSDVKVCCTVGFPLGANATSVKVFEASNAIKDGAQEIDMVINIGGFLSGNYRMIENEIKEVVAAANGHCVKVIIETCLLNDEQIIKACEIVSKTKATFVKTSTGFSTAGANPRIVKLMKDTVGDTVKVKAAGGVRNKEELKLMIEAGADRIGTSSGVALVSDEVNNR